MSLRGKTALITGAAGGLGLVIARALFAAGANVVVCDIHDERLADAEASFAPATPPAGCAQPSDKKDHGGSPAPGTLFRRVDVTDEDSVRALVADAVRAFGTLHVVVNNAAIMDRFDPAGTCEKELWERVLAVNVTGPFLVTKHTLPHLLLPHPGAHINKENSVNEDAAPVGEATSQEETERRGGGAETGGLIVNIASNASFRGLSAGVAYTASKHAVLGLTRNTAGFYGPQGVSCVALALGGLADTNISDAFAPPSGGSATAAGESPAPVHGGVNREGVGKMMTTQPGTRIIKAEDVARMVVFLAEGGGKGMNGGCVTMNENWPEA